MPIYTSATEGGTFTPAPEGVHQAVCVDVVDLGMKESTWEGKTKQLHKIAISWQISELRDDGKPFLVSKWYTLSIGEKANLRKDLQSWRGRAFTPAEEAQFDVETIIGANCLLNIQHKESNGKTYANVISVMPLLKGMPKIAASADYVRVCDRPKDGQPATEHYQQPQHEESHQPVTDLDDSDIPFAWLLPLLLTAGTMVA